MQASSIGETARTVQLSYTIEIRERLCLKCGETRVSGAPPWTVKPSLSGSATLSFAAQMSTTILLRDSDSARRARVCELLREAGFAVVDPGGTGPHEQAGELSAAVVSANEASALLPRLLARRLPVVVIASEGVDARALFEAGADDVVRIPRDEGELAARVRARLRMSDTITALEHEEREARAMLELTQTLASTLDFSDILFTVVRRIAEFVRVERVSIVLSLESEEGQAGYVVAASDDQEITNLRIDLERYPEIREVLRTRKMLTIRDASTHPVLDGVRQTMPDGALGALSLLPIVFQDDALGVLFLRAPKDRGALSRNELAFCQIVANAMAVALRNARIMQTLRDRTQQVTFARFEAERRLRASRRYANLFTSAADGLAAVDPDGNLLFANPRAYEIASLTENEVRGRSLATLVTRADRPRLFRIWRDVRQGKYPQNVDLRLLRPDGTTRVLSCSFAELQEGEGAVLFSFRDMTKERETAAELAKTKDFLESLIESSVDGIIAADLRGRVLLFNKGAERIYGYAAEEVIGKLSVGALYLPGGAKQVMKMIRSPSHGGVGRLETTRFDVRDRAGRTVPVNLSAAMIYDESGAPYASVGIFADLREKLRVEERLVQAQQKLAVSEKQVLIAELAGTAAHELNQPLTSVIAYAQLLERKLAAGSAEAHAASVIRGEGERMADIVRKIGKITRYETKSYVGAQKILDLDASSSEGAEGGTE